MTTSRPPNVARTPKPIPITNRVTVDGPFNNGVSVPLHKFPKTDQYFQAVVNTLTGEVTYRTGSVVGEEGTEQEGNILDPRPLEKLP